MKKNTKVSKKKRQEVLQGQSRQETPQRSPAEKRPTNATVKKRLCPPELAKLMYTINRVPNGLPWLRDLRLMADGHLDDLDLMVWNEVAKLPQSLRDQIPEPPAKDDRMGRLRWIVGSHVEGQHSRARLYYCYDYAQQGKVALGAVADHPAVSLGPFFLETHFDVDTEGNLRLHAHPILEALKDVEAARIRRCPICDKIYWAERIDQPACSKRCNNTRRSQIFRGKLQPS
jgi:hypothetical protein